MFGMAGVMDARKAVGICCSAKANILSAPSICPVCTRCTSAGASSAKVLMRARWSIRNVVPEGNVEDADNKGCVDGNTWCMVALYLTLAVVFMLDFGLFCSAYATAAAAISLLLLPPPRQNGHKRRRNM